MPERASEYSSKRREDGRAPAAGAAAARRSPLRCRYVTRARLRSHPRTWAWAAAAAAAARYAHCDEVEHAPVGWYLMDEARELGAADLPICLSGSWVWLGMLSATRGIPAARCCTRACSAARFIHHRRDIRGMRVRERAAARERAEKGPGDASACSRLGCRLFRE